jgi:hypothetical protein
MLLVYVEAMTVPAIDKAVEGTRVRSQTIGALPNPSIISDLSHLKTKLRPVGCLSTHHGLSNTGKTERTVESRSRKDKNCSRRRTCSSTFFSSKARLKSFDPDSLPEKSDAVSTDVLDVVDHQLGLVEGEGGVVGRVVGGLEERKSATWSMVEGSSVRMTMSSR